ncbi:MAG: T9SS type A sorting domain-containing protein [Puia sp.]
MVIAPDDFGYTITNDGNHLIRFSTNGAPALTDLGELQDDPLNKDMSIRNNPCANSGGDLIADDAGSLFLVTGSNRVFKVDIATRKTTYLATISALPAKFTTSGVAVSEDGKMLVSSSLYADGYFTVDPETWNATPSSGAHEAFGSADLANSNVLHSKTAANSNLFITKAPDKLSQFRVFPNPVMDDEVSIQFNGLKPGNYTIQLASVLGNTVLKQKATIIGTIQTELVHIPGSTAQGFYYVSILDENNKVVGTQKLVVERW